MGDIGYLISLVEPKTKTVLGSWIRCVSIMVPGSHLRRQWCRTCRRRPGTCAAPRWASPSSGRLPSSHTDVKAFWSEVVLEWSDRWVEKVATGESGGLWGRLAPPSTALCLPQCHCLEAEPCFRLNYSNSTLTLRFQKNVFNTGRELTHMISSCSKSQNNFAWYGLKFQCQFWLHNKIYLAHYFRGI